VALTPPTGVGDVTLTVQAATVPNPILDAALGLNSTGDGTTRIGSGGAFVALNGSSVTLNGEDISQTGSVTIGNANAGEVLVTSPTLNINTVGSGTTTIGNLYGATGVVVNGPLNRVLGFTNVQQPIIQYGRATGLIGASGSATGDILITYTDQTTYVVHVTMMDSPAAQLYATPVSGNSFTIGWQSAGGGPHTIMWTTFGT
jgi:hypothetical protein